jgi:hypothetical protein
MLHSMGMVYGVCCIARSCCRCSRNLYSVNVISITVWYFCSFFSRLVLQLPCSQCYLSRLRQRSLIRYIICWQFDNGEKNFKRADKRVLSYLFPIPLNLLPSSTCFVVSSTVVSPNGCSGITINFRLPFLGLTCFFDATAFFDSTTLPDPTACCDATAFFG